ncbi:hypothetical protein D9M68_333160 [compost metagenome]
MQGEARSDGAAEGMADDDRATDAALFHQLCDRRRLAVRKVVFRSAPLGVAVTRTIDEQHLGAAIKGWGEGMQLIEQIATGAMDEDDGQEIGLLACRQVHAVHAITADVDQFAGIRKPPGEGSRVPEAVGNADER